MTSDRFNEIIVSLNEKTDILIVDGLSMMGGSGSELELANKHSKELKELAKTHNIFVMAIVHASKGEDYETRDLTRKARASEKIIDNCDFAMTMSMIKEDGNFNERKGVYNCWNKRGTGKRIQKGFEFEKNTWALKGDAQVFGFMTATGTDLPINEPVALSATQCGATIHKGTNADADVANCTGIDSL